MWINLATRAALCLAIASSLCSGQPTVPAPSFEADRVLPSGGDRAVPLAPGLLISIYGNHLGPVSGCEGFADTQRRETPNPLRPNQIFASTLIYPKALCETQVLVGGVPAGLLYVQERQINFKVPQQTPVEGTTEIHVIYRGQKSSAVRLPLGLESSLISLESPARVGMPVWVKLSMPGLETAVQYPFDIHPAGFACHDVEVRRDGKPLPRVATLATRAIGGIAGSGSACSFLGLPAESHHIGRIPLHLQYRFDQPGTYQVRYTMYSDFPATIRSAWTAIEILPGTPRERTQWLKELSTQAPDDTVALLTDFLPNLLGVPDQQSLELLSRYLYHSDSLVRQYAMYGLTYWPGPEADAVIREAVNRKGPTDVAVQFLLRTPELLASQGDSLVDGAIPYLRSASPVLVRGAVTAIFRGALLENPRANPALRTRAETAMVLAANHVVSVGDPQTISDYTAALGTLRNDRASPVLWDLIRRNVAREQAVIALAWRHSPADLPKLAQLTLVPAHGRGNVDRELSGLASAIRRGYGAAALPYLETMLARSEFTPVRIESARELMLAGRSAGFAFAADAIENARAYRREMIDFVRGQFAELRQAGDAAVLTFVKVRAAAK